MIALADCAIVVTNAKESARWWKEKVGFGVHEVGSGGHAVMVAPPGDRFVLHLCEGFGAVEAGNSGIAFVTDEIETMVKGMEAAGVAFPEPLTKESWGSFAKFADPDGNIFWLMEAPRAFIRKEISLRAPSGRRRPPSSRKAVRRPKRRGGRRASR
jgi:catechol 2,3-dioxygenase-like lactoylglutathione lyase family enzyme